MVSVFLLIDASIPAKKIDLDYASWLGQNKVSILLKRLPPPPIHEVIMPPFFHPYALGLLFDIVRR